MALFGLAFTFGPREVRGQVRSEIYPVETVTLGTRQILSGQRNGQPTLLAGELRRGKDEILKAAPAGWIATQSARAQASRADTQRRNEAGKKTWDPASHPAWLTEEVYRKEVRPRLMEISTSRIASVLAVSWAHPEGRSASASAALAEKLAGMVGYATVR